MTINTYEEWKEAYRKLNDERISFRAYFVKHRTCRCRINPCRHLTGTEVELEFKHKAWDLHQQYMNMFMKKVFVCK